MHKPLVTVVCLCYNHERFVRESIGSVINQSYENIEIIIWDDGSSDNSPSVIRELMKKHPHLLVTLSDRNEGNCRAFNRAFSKARGEFIVDFATDDVMEQTRIEKQVSVFLASDDQTGVVFTDATHISESGATLRHHYEHLFRHHLITHVATGDVFRNVLTTYYIASPTMMMRRSVLDALGGYDEQLSYEDFDLWVRSARVFKYAFLDERLTLIRKSANAMSTGWYAIGDRQLLSTYHVCLKAVGLCRDDGDRSALLWRVKYELKHSALSGNREEAMLFWRLLKAIGVPHAKDTFWYAVNSSRVPLAWLRRLYQRWRYAR